MNRKKRGKGYGGFRKRSALALILCAALTLGVCAPEYGMTVQAAESAAVEAVQAERTEVVANSSTRAGEDIPGGVLPKVSTRG